MKIVVVGSQDVMAWSLVELVKQAAPLAWVATHEAPWDRKFNELSIEAVAREKGIRCVTLDRRQLSGFWSLLKDEAPDFLFSIYNRFIVPPDVLRTIRQGSINFHPSLLPKYRGPIPTFWALSNGEKVTGVTAHLMEKDFDAGDIFFQEKFGISREDTGHTLHRKAMQRIVSLVTKVYQELAAGRTLPRIKQKESEATYGCPWNENLRWINWQRDAEAISNQVRSMTRPYVGALTDCEGVKAIVWRVKIGEGLASENVPGELRRAEGDRRIQIAAKDRWVLIEDYEFLPQESLTLPKAETGKL